MCVCVCGWRNCTVWRVYSQVNGYVRDALIAAGDAIGFRFDFATNLVEIGEFFAFAVQEFAMFCKKISHEKRDTFIFNVFLITKSENLKKF